MNDKRTVTIYRIYNRITQKSYIGSSKNGLVARWNTHIKKLQANEYPGDFQKDWNTHGITAWDFSVLEECIPLSEQFNRESYWIHKYGEYNALKLKLVETAKVVELLKEGRTFRDIQYATDVCLGTIHNIKRKYITG